jgi:uncharacterized protein (DUF427 family)
MEPPRRARFVRAEARGTAMSDGITISEAGGTWVVRGGGAILGESERALRLEETGHDPVIYFPREDIAMAFLEPSATTARSPRKGDATYFSLQTKSVLVADVAWSYENPEGAIAAVGGYLAFDPDRVAVEEV